jgi:hypothetical protein
VKVAVLIDERSLCAWEHALLADIVGSDCAEIVVRIGSGNSPERDARSRTESRLAKWLARRRTGRQERADAFEVWTGVSPLDVVNSVWLPEVTEVTGREHVDVTQAAVRRFAPDVIIALDWHPIMPSLANASRYGIWFYTHGVTSSVSAAADRNIGLHEVLRRSPTIESTLSIRTASADMQDWKYVTHSSVNPRSFCRTRDEHFWKLARIIPRFLASVAEEGIGSIADLPRAKNMPARENSPVGRRPVPLTRTLRDLTGYVFWRLRDTLMNRFTKERLTLMINLDGEVYDTRRYTRLIPRAGWFWADPCLVRNGEDYVVFFEEASLLSGKGHISAIRIDRDGRISEPEIVIDRPYHLSYPFVFRYDGDIYMIPESAENETVELYQCRRWPADWVFVRNLIEGESLYDVTLYEHQGLWWMFANMRAREGASDWDELCLFYNASPVTNGWQAHPKNPVISDVRRARPAGKMFLDNGRLIRPSQDSSFRYGYRISLNEVIELSKTMYREEHLRYMEPGDDRSIRAIHTFSHCDDLAIVDAMHRLGRFSSGP